MRGSRKVESIEELTNSGSEGNNSVNCRIANMMRRSAYTCDVGSGDTMAAAGVVQDSANLRLSTAGGKRGILVNV
jgi:predicted hotdog family 3-hydroxylacyl-ACP dehydratase